MNAMPDAPAGTTPVLRPLVVDLDHTLVKTDTLVESLIQLFFSAPGRFLAVLASALKGRAAFKAAIAKNIALDGAALPYDPAVLDLIKARRADGGSVHLVSAAHQSIVTAVSEEKAGLFDTAVGTDGSVNLKGDNKAKFLIGRFGRDFAYLGDSKADIHVWSVAAEALIVARGGGVVDLARRKGVTPSTVIPRPGASAKDWIRALRVHQWTKNGVILLPLILSQQALIPAQLAKAVMAFILFGLVASGTYLINDLSDLAADRAHPKKCNRPVPAGRIPVTHAAVAACALLLFGLGTAWATSPPLFMALICYVGLTLAYSFVLKRKALIDLLVIGTLFTIRVGAGMACIGQPLSVWLCAFTVMLFTSWPPPSATPRSSVRVGPASPWRAATTCRKTRR